MGFSLSQQTFYFLYAIVLGIIMGAIFEITRLVRFLGLKNKALMIAFDILFCLVCAILTFMFSLAYYSGVVRIYTLIGEAAGFIIFHFTIGELLKHVYKYLHIVLNKIIKILKNMSKKVLKAVSHLVYNIGGKTDRRKKKND